MVDSSSEEDFEMNKILDKEEIEATDIKASIDAEESELSISYPDSSNFEMNVKRKYRKRKSKNYYTEVMWQTAAKKRMLMKSRQQQ